MKSSSEAPRRWKRLLQNLGLAAGTFLLCVVLFEVILRLNGYGKLEIYQPDPKLYWRLKPNQDCFTKIDHKPVHINSHGTRGPDFAVPKPAGVFRILSLGDSRTFGWGLSESETYSARLEALLNQGRGRTNRVEVINAGVNAWSYPQMLTFLRDFALAWQPDMVVIGEANQWTQFSEKNSPEFVKSFMRRVWLKNFLRHFAIYHYVIEVQLKDFYERHRAKFIPVDPHQDTLFKEQQQNNPEALFRSAIQGLCFTALTNHVQPVLVFFPTLDELNVTNPPPVLKAKQDLAAHLQIPLVDLTPALRPGGKALYLDADPVHPDSRGSEVIARQIFDAVKPLVGP